MTIVLCCAEDMKFGKLLQSRAEELKSTGLTEHFLRYKALKKTLKQISKEPQQGEQPASEQLADEQPAGELPAGKCWTLSRSHCIRRLIATSNSGYSHVSQMRIPGRQEKLTALMGVVQRTQKLGMRSSHWSMPRTDWSRTATPHNLRCSACILAPIAC